MNIALWRARCRSTPNKTESLVWRHLFGPISTWMRANNLMMAEPRERPTAAEDDPCQKCSADWFFLHSAKVRDVAQNPVRCGKRRAKRVTPTRFPSSRSEPRQTQTVRLAFLRLSTLAEDRTILFKQILLIPSIAPLILASGLSCWVLYWACMQPELIEKSPDVVIAALVAVVLLVFTTAAAAAAVSAKV